MSKTCSFIKAGAILGGTVIVTAAVAPLFLPNQNVKPLTSAQAAEITAQTMNSKCADCHKPGTHISELVNTLSGGLLARHIRDGQRSYNMEEPPTAVTLSKLEHVLQINSMPPTSYTMVHWGSTLTLREKNAMLQWIKDERLKIFGDMVGEEYALSPLAPIPDALPTDPAKVALGYKLFHDVRLSTDNTVSCASCHSLEKSRDGQPAHFHWSPQPERRHQCPHRFQCRFPCQAILGRTRSQPPGTGRRTTPESGGNGVRTSG